MKHVSENKLVLVKMLEIYKPKDIDWMSYKITRNNGLTLHHIVEESKGGITVVENGALVTKSGHRVLNMLYGLDRGLYNEWNALFRLINQSMVPPTEEMVEEAKILKKFSQNRIYSKKI